MTRIVTSHYHYRRPPRRRLLGISGLIGLAAAGPTLGADTFDGAYTGKRVLTKGLEQCVASEDVSVIIHGSALTFTDSALRDFSIGFNPHQDGSLGLISASISGNAVLIRGRKVGDVLDADVTNGPCEHHWHLTKHPP